MPRVTITIDSATLSFDMIEGKNFNAIIQGMNISIVPAALVETKAVIPIEAKVAASVVSDEDHQRYLIAIKRQFANYNHSTSDVIRNELGRFIMMYPKASVLEALAYLGVEQLEYLIQYAYSIPKHPDFTPGFGW